MGSIVYLFTRVFRGIIPATKACWLGRPFVVFFSAADQKSNRKPRNRPSISAGRSDVPLLRGIVEELCLVTFIVVYTVRPRIGGLPAWTIIWPSVPSAATPWLEKMMTSLRRILIAKNPKFNLNPNAGTANPNGPSSPWSPTGAPAACGRPIHKGSLPAPCIYWFFDYIKDTLGDELPFFLLLYCLVTISAMKAPVIFERSFMALFLGELWI